MNVDAEFAALGHRPLSLRHSIRAALANARGDLRFAVVPGVLQVDGELDDEFLAGEILAARKATHDAVVLMTGRARLSGVVWIERRGPTARDLLKILTEDDDGAVSSVRVGPMLEHPALVEVLEAHPLSILIVATVLADAQAARAALS